MGRIIPLNGEAHHELQLLLPWYVTGRLEPDERAQVEAHLETCGECQAELVLERRLRAEIADLPVEVDEAWARMRERMPAERPAPVRAARRRDWRSWAIAAQFVLLLAAGAALVAPRVQPARYEALGAGAAPPAAAIVVIFRPDATEAAIRAGLAASGARLSDGPTAAGAYVLRVPEARREAALAALRGDGAVVLAQPIDAAESP